MVRSSWAVSPIAAPEIPLSACMLIRHASRTSRYFMHSAFPASVVEKKSWDQPIDKVNAMVQENVFAQLSNIKTHPSVAVGLRNNALRLHGWVYDIESGEIRALDKATKTFVSLSENPEVFFE